METLKSITFDNIACASESFHAERANEIAKNSVTSNGVRASAKVPERAAYVTRTFDIEIEQGSRTDQKRSGRCWMFAALNTFRVQTMKKFKLKDFEFSQAYPLFWDKFEKSNWFLENIIDTLEEPLDSRLVQFLLSDPVSDGGQWDMFKALVKKYGVVPKEAMPEAASATNTNDLDGYLTRYLRKSAYMLRTASKNGSTPEELRTIKQGMMEEVYKMLVICLGEPPAVFDVRLRDKDDKLVLSGTYTPREFYEEAVGSDLDDYVSVISASTSDKPYRKTYTVKRLGNVIEAGGVKYLNLSMDDMKKAVIAQLEDGYPVWFGCDVDQQFISADGIMDIDSLDIDALFGIPVIGGFDRAARLDYGESLMTHAMVIEGVNLSAAGKPTLWKVENSWGKDHGKDGFDAMSDRWFDEYVYQAVINKKYLSEEDVMVFETMEPIELEPWDPFGSLAN